ncbi:PorP/SprF family type IX secretion system membrane protein [Marinilabilia salmonicolor]|jgi:type IX secretion system PorP/SprF family membrane protein|uniref:Type IX secretion system PorP/SprF family membrane protein n=1 Tax=Marinilabilia salmonicolor TaxID=989 RepID=A0A2T0XBT5_9BACT|nr:PorP/SprF family type IX secretion system membrane protein [Marinilabilia salmonicolor]PRY96377.1 type IX secretion system PorP/SprF family membrane protein [Marinilabilia salmonicolor]RCW37552.1 type IX secretion system PorP/SprF family membrane protein [Marinilabilia salmonicolor]
MRRLILSLSLLLFTLTTFGQNYFITNQYAYDLFLVNPADAGNNSKCITFNGFYQKQWFGVDLAPTTQLFAFQAPLMNNLGSGTYVFNDRNGNYNRMGLQQSFSVEIKLRENRNGFTSLHFGLSAIIDHTSLDYGNFTDGAALDPVISGAAESGTSFNANTGLMLEVNNYHIGVAISELFAQNNPMYQSEWEPKTGPVIHAHAGTSWKFPDRDLYIEPLFYYRRDANSDTRFDANLKLYMPTPDPNFALWGILAYRRSMDEQLGRDLGLGTTVGIDYRSFSFGVEHQLGLTSAQKQFGSALLLVAGYRICSDKSKRAMPCTQKDAIIKAAQRDKNRGLKGIKDATAK